MLTGEDSEQFAQLLPTNYENSLGTFVCLKHAFICLCCVVCTNILVCIYRLILFLSGEPKIRSSMRSCCPCNKENSLGSFVWLNHVCLCEFVSTNMLVCEYVLHVV